MIEDVRDKNPKTTLYCGLMVADDIENAMDAALNHGAEGISIFTVSALRTPESRAMFKAYADSVRAVRAENNGVNPALSKSTKVTNPFESMDILNRINAKIKELANVPIPNIADYKLVNEKRCHEILRGQRAEHRKDILRRLLLLRRYSFRMECYG